MSMKYILMKVELCSTDVAQNPHMKTSLSMYSGRETTLLNHCLCDMFDDILNTIDRHSKHWIINEIASGIQIFIAMMIFNINF